MSILIPGRLEFFDDSPELTPAAARQRFSDWYAGRRVMSKLVAVGRIFPSEADERLLRELRTHIEPHHAYDMDIDPFFQRPEMQALQQDLKLAAAHDMARVGVSAEGSTVMWAGRALPLGWHPDHERIVRWNVSLGDTTTVAAIGEVTQDDAPSPRIEALLADGTLVEKGFAVGTILRLIQGDIHRGDEGNRMFASNTAREQDYVSLAA